MELLSERKITHVVPLIGLKIKLRYRFKRQFLVLKLIPFAFKILSKIRLKTAQECCAPKNMLSIAFPEGGDKQDEKGEKL